MFRLNRNERSHWSGNGVHVESELVFMIGRNMQQFGFVKARYKGLLKNDNQLAMLFTLANLFRVDQMIRQWERSH